MAITSLDIAAVASHGTIWSPRIDYQYRPPGGDSIKHKERLLYWTRQWILCYRYFNLDL